MNGFDDEVVVLGRWTAGLPHVGGRDKVSKSSLVDQKAIAVQRIEYLAIVRQSSYQASHRWVGFIVRELAA
jgi:hypothetical protein